MVVPFPLSLPSITVAVVTLSWIAFAALFVFRRRPPGAREEKRDRSSWNGVMLVAVGYLLVWSIRRPIFSPLIPAVPWIDAILSVVGMLVSVLSVSLVLAAVRTLGKQWSVEARLVEDHRLITGGPYAFVRNPIYTGMLGMMASTGIAFSHLWVLAAALAFGWYGTHLRVRREELLLRQRFGEEFEQYARRVPALLPWTRR